MLAIMSILEKPWEYLPRNMISTLCALLRAGYLNNYDIRKISEDGFFDNTLLQVYDEMDFQGKKSISIPAQSMYLNPTTAKKLLNFTVIFTCQTRYPYV